MAARKEAKTSLRCSFCKKREGVVGTLISSPDSEACICDECILVCNVILEDESRAVEPDPRAPTQTSRFVQHPLALDFLTATEKWAVRDATGLPARQELDQLRSLAATMLAQPSSPAVTTEEPIP